VRLDEIAEVTDRWERIRRIVRVNGAPGLRLAVNKQSGTNTVDVAKRVLVEIDRINQDIPQVNIVPIIDSSKYIERSISNVGASALYGGLFAIIVLLVFLRSIRSTGIIAISIPVSIIATFAMIYFGGFTLNLMTLGGLALGVGMLVDNSIVVLENIFRLRSEQRSPERAAVRGTSEVTWAIIASTLTTLAIFLPMVFLRGMAGIMFKQLAFVVSFSLVCSLIVALTLIPMLSARLLRVEASAGPLTRGWRRRLFDATGAAFTWLELHYKSLLHFALQHRLAVLAFAALLLAGSLALTPFIGSELMPQGDEGEVRVEIELEVGTRIGLVDNTVQLIESIIEREVPEMESMVASIGGGGWGGGAVNEAEIRLALVPMAKRDRSSEDVAAALRRRLSGIPGTTIRTRAGQGMFLLRRMMGGSARIEVEIRGYDLDTADKLAQQVRSLTERVPGVTDTQLSRESGAPERLVRVDRAKAEAMKVEVQDIAGLLQTIVSGTRAGNFRDAGEEFAIRVKLKDSERIPLSDLLDMTVTNADGVPIVLRNFVSLEPRRGMMQVERKNQERIVTVRANIADRDMSSILADIRQQLDTIPAPPGFTIGFGGDYADQQETFRELALGLVLSLLLVYIVMACLYESLRDPFVVMFSVPLAIIGVVLMLFLTGTTLNMQSFIGIIMLGGIVVNNAILLVDYTNLLRREEGMDLRQAIEEAGRRRLRPIMMTAFTTIFGLIPLALGLGEGGEAQAPMARAVVGGLVSSTLVTLVVVPVIYSYFHQNTNGRGRVAEDIGDLGPAEGM